MARCYAALLLVAAALIAACGHPSNVPTLDARAPAVCSGVRCAEGEVCCYATGLCIDVHAPESECGSASRVVTAGGDASFLDVADASDAPVVAVPGDPPPLTPSPDEHVCFSDRDCADTEFCDARFCLGPGVCRARLNCGFCTTGNEAITPGEPAPDPPPGSSCQVCGCDGLTYPGPQTACRFGVRVAGSGACGRATTITADAGGTRRARIACGVDAECPASQRCCSILGSCVDRSCDTCCRFPPAGASWPCRDDLDCNPFEFCDGMGCGTPGGCVRIPAVESCPGVIDPVCACDGRSYTNECTAHADGQRVAHTVACN